MTCSIEAPTWILLRFTTTHPIGTWVTLPDTGIRPLGRLPVTNGKRQAVDRLAITAVLPNEGASPRGAALPDLRVFAFGPAPC